MPYILVSDFKLGLDRRRPRHAAYPGAVWDAVDCHLTRGADLEKRKAFVSTYALPSGTYGLAGVADVLYVFGSGVNPGVPAGVTYQRLQHPDGIAMTKVLSVTSFDGKPHVAAEFTGGLRAHFYDGTYIPDFQAGIVRASMANNAGIATHLAALIDADPLYTASAVGAVITVTAAVPGNSFTITGETVNVEGGTADQTITIATPTANVVGVNGAKATGSFRVTGGTANAANKWTSVKVNSVEILGADVLWTTSDTATAALIAAQINTFSSTPNYTATSLGDKVIIEAPVTGTTANGLLVGVTCAGGVSSCTGGFDIVEGTAGGGNTISSVKVNGVEILTTPVAWTTSHSATATAVAAQIVSTVSTPEYVASARNQHVVISRTVSSSTDPVNLVVEVTFNGTVVCTALAACNNTITDMSGGVTAVSAVAQVSTATIGGTFEIGDQFTVLVDTKPFGHKGNPEFVPDVVFTHGAKVYGLAESLLEYSEVNNSSLWNEISTLQAGSINISNNASGSTKLYGIEVFQGLLVLLARNTTQLWSVKEDQAFNQLAQTLRSTGTRSPKSVKGFGDLDVFYLSDRGVRTLRARSGTVAASVADIGTPIDSVVIDYARTLTDAQIEAACAVVDPIDGRYMLALGNRIFVLSFYSESKVSGWTYYLPGFEITDWAITGSNLYCRSGNTIYLYGGAAGDSYAISMTLKMPYLYGNQPGTFKQVHGVDIAGTGDFAISGLIDPRDDTQSVSFGTLSGVTYTDPNTFVAGVHTTHIAPEITSTNTGPSVISQIAIYYDGADSE